MKILDLDIETAPNIAYTWGLFNQNISLDQIVKAGYTLCWAAQWRGSNKTMFKSIYHDSEEEMILEIHSLLDEADIVVHYNGRKFDIPILNKEFIKHKLVPPSTYQQVDLLEAARRNFKFASNKLDYVSQFLGLEAKLEHKGMKLWVGCLDGDKKSWDTMKKYNIQDVKLLPRLYERLLPWIKDHPNMALYSDVEERVCPNCGSKHVTKRGVERLKTQSYQRYKCNDCGTNIRGRTTILPLSKRKTVLTQSNL